MRFVPHHEFDEVAHVRVIRRLEKKTVAAVLDEVDRAAGARCDDRDAARVGFLQGLPEGFLRSGVQKEVETRVCGRKFVPGELAEIGHRHSLELTFERTHRWPIADDGKADAAKTTQRRQTLHLLFWGDPPDVANDRFPLRSEALAEPLHRRFVPVARVVGHQVDAAAPSCQPLDSRALQVGHRCRRRHQGEFGSLVDPAHNAPGETGGCAQVVSAGVTGDIRLEDCDGWDAESRAGRNRLCPQQKGRRRVDYVWREVGEEFLNLRARQTDREPAVGKSGDLVDRETGVTARGASGWHDDDRVVAVVAQIVQHLAHAVGDPVEGG